MTSASEVGAAEMWSAAKAAAERLVPRVLLEWQPSLSIGTALSVEVVRALAAEAGVEAREQVCVYDDGPKLIAAMQARHEGVSINAQGSRPATEEDVRRCGGAHRYTKDPRLTVEQALEAVQ